MSPLARLLHTLSFPFICHCVRVSGLSVFRDLLKGRNVHVYSDNVGAEYALVRNRAKSWDHTCLVHGIWYRALSQFLGAVVVPSVPARLKAMEWSVGLFISRVPSEDNLSDDPSREKYNLLHALKAIHVEPWLCPSFAAAQTWQALSILGRV